MHDRSTVALGGCTDAARGRRCLITMTRVAVIVLLVLLGGTLGSPPAWARSSEETDTSSEQARAYFDEGLQHQKAERYQEAIRAYRKSLRYDPDQAEALSNLGFCYKSVGRYHKAIGYYREALRIDPNLAEAHEYLGEAYLGLGKVKLAKREYKILLRLDPDEADELKEHIDAALAQINAQAAPQE